MIMAQDAEKKLEELFLTVRDKDPDTFEHFVHYALLKERTDPAAATKLQKQALLVKIPDRSDNDNWLLQFVRKNANRFRLSRREATLQLQVQLETASATEARRALLEYLSNRPVAPNNAAPNKELEELKDKVARQEKIIEEFKGKDTDVAHFKDEYVKVQIEKTALQNEVNTLSTKLRKSATALERLSDELKALKEVDPAIQLGKNYQNKQADLERKVKDLQEGYDYVVLVRDNLQVAHQVLEKQVGIHEETIAKLRAKLKEVEKKGQPQTQPQVSADVANIQEENAKLRGQVFTLTAAQEDKKLELEKLQKQLANAENLVKETQETSTKKSNLVKEAGERLRKLRDEIKELQTQVNVLSQDRDAERAARLEMQMKLENAVKSNAGTEAKELTERLDVSEKENASLKQKIAELSEQMKKAQIDADARYAERDEAVSNMGTNLSLYSAHFEEQKTKIADLEQQLRAEQEKSSKYSKDLESLKAEMKKQISPTDAANTMPVGAQAWTQAKEKALTKAKQEAEEKAAALEKELAAWKEKTVYAQGRLEARERKTTDMANKLTEVILDFRWFNYLYIGVWDEVNKLGKDSPLTLQSLKELEDKSMKELEVAALEAQKVRAAYYTSINKQVPMKPPS